MSSRFQPPAVMVALLIAACAATNQAVNAADAPPNPGWPRTHAKDGNTLVMYQPQVDEWRDHSKIHFRAAIVLTHAGSTQPHYGVMSAQADTLVDVDARMVLVTNLDLAARFSGVDDATAASLKAIARDVLPNKTYLKVSLDQVLACLPHDAATAPRVNLSLDPPPMYYSDSPAILVIYMGQPQFKPIKNTGLMFAANTNWAIFMDMKSSQYYLLDGESWLTTTDPVKGPWAAATTLPADLSKLPAEANWDDVRKNVPGKPATIVPKVITSMTPAELILTNGAPEFTPIPGTRLMYVSNPEMPLFLDLADSNYYYLVAGRWFRAASVSGPWTAASADLPPEFAKIPSDSPLGFVLASVPRTQEAMDAILLASVPQKATVNISEAKVQVIYEGEPQFVPIQGTTMTYAVNTPYQVIQADGRYYCCHQGVWFVAAATPGPWLVCTAVPTVIYTIPPACPLYNVTYVRVYSSTPTTVVVGYTSGYSGQYVAATGALMFGAGMVTGAIIAENSHGYGCYPSYYSYGAAVHYSYASGGYYKTGGSSYGPAGGAAWGSSYNSATGTFARSAAVSSPHASAAGAQAYNPSTGTVARAGAVSTPHGSAWGAQAYNPFTGTAATHTGSTNGYQSWGSTTVSQGDKWAQASHTSTPNGTAGHAENSSGQSVQGAHAGDSTVAKTGSGDVYAGHDGNVYKKSDGQWQKSNGSGGWDDTSAKKPSSSGGSTAKPPASSGNTTSGERSSQRESESSLNRESYSRERGSQNAEAASRSRSGGGRGRR